MPKAKKLPSGNWRALIYVGKDENGKRQYKSFTDSSKKKAEYAAAEYMLRHKKITDKDKLTFKEAAEAYIENKENVLSPSTIRGYKSMLKADYPLLLNVRIDHLDASDLIQKQMNINAKNHSAKSLSNQFGL
jgi:hypothetical protein